MNVNEATQEELEALPGVGPATAEKLMKARPIADGKELEGLIPPSAWLKIQEEGVQFAFEKRDAAENDIKGPPPEGDVRLEAAPILEAIIAPEPVLKMRGEPFVLKRLVTRADRPNEGLKAGAEYMCVWNMKHGPSGEAWFPEDAPTEAYVEQWFKDNGMTIKFAHWGPSVQLTTPNRGLVDLVLFEILEEETNAEANQGVEKGD